MIVATYARKSNEQNSVADAEKSVSRQIEHARAYAERKGWTVTGEHVYVDDGVSGALFGEKRPGLARLLGALQPQSPLKALRAALADLKATLHGAVGPARQVLRSLLAARLTFTPVEREGERFYTFTAPGNVSP